MHLEYLPIIIILFIIFSFFIIRENKKFFLWVKTYWFFERSKKNVLSTFLYLIAFLFLVISLLDLRGAETKIKAQIPDQKTIVIIDSSASMLAEDVRPNRFKKSILMARHFVKKAVGHQIAVVLFSDTQKRLVPFTDDLDLLDSRLAALETLNIRNGGSNISQAIMESMQYFKMDSVGDDNEIGGNVLVFTDSEEGDDSIKTKIPANVNLAMVGVGTLKGAQIPIRNRKGALNGYKRHNGKEVISKLNENALKSYGTQAKNFKYWIAQSFTIPTEQILSFFRKIHKSKLSKGDVRIRPVASEKLLIPFIVLYVLSILFGRAKSFSVGVLCLFIFLGYQPLSYAKTKEVEKSEKQIKEELAKKGREEIIQQGLDLLKSGDLSREGRLKLAENFMDNGEIEKSRRFYLETIDDWDKEEVKPLINFGTSLLFTKRIKEGAQVYNYLKNERNLTDDQKDLLRQNLLKALRKNKQDKKKQQKQEKQDKKDKQNKDKKQKQDQNQDQDKKQNKKEQNKDQGQEKKKDQKKDQNKKQDNKEKNKDKNEEKEKSEKQKKEKENGEGNDSKKKKKPQKSQTLEEKEAELRKKRKMVKIPATVKQILSEDRALQKRYIDTTNRQKRKNRTRKDW
jgi:Ca-activated chloride channel family protein